MMQKNASVPVSDIILFYSVTLIASIGLVLIGSINLIFLILLCVIGFVGIIWCAYKPVRFVYTLIVYNCFIKYAISDFGVPRIANYVSDILIVVFFMIALIERSKKRLYVGIKWPMICITIMFLSGICSYVYNSSSNPFLFLWSFRNYYRFFGFFFGCTIFLKHEDIERIFHILVVVLYANVLMCTYQYFGLGIKGDYLGGFFGTSQGCNAYVNILLCILTIQSIVFFLTKRMSLFSLLSVICSALYIATLSEVKLYYIELIVVIILVSLLFKPNRRTLAVIVGGMSCCIIGIQALYMLYPDFANFFIYETMMNSASQGGYSDAFNLNRLTALQTIKDMFFQDPFQLLFGIGMGNAETSQFPLFTSNVFRQYGEWLNYSWFSHAFMFLEGGWIGLGSYCAFFAAVFLSSFFSKSKNNRENVYYVISAIMALMCYIQIIYNSALRTEAGYFVFYILAIPFALQQKEYLCKKYGQTSMRTIV